MKGETPEAMGAVVEKAKKEVTELLASGRVFQYMCLRQIMDDADPLSRLVEELFSLCSHITSCLLSCLHFFELY